MSEIHAADQSLPGSQQILLKERKGAENNPWAGGLGRAGAEARQGGEIS